MDEYESSEPMEEAELPEETGAQPGGAADQEQDHAFMVSDAREFSRQHPEVDIGKLEDNPVFIKFCGSRLGKESLVSLYEDFIGFADETMRAARDAVESKSSRATGSGGSGGGSGLTAEQQRELDEWNKAFPKLKMSAREFLDR